MDTKMLHTIILFGVSFGFITAGLVTNADNKQAFGWPGQATVAVTVNNHLDETLESEAILSNPNGTEFAKTAINVPTETVQKVILTTNSTNIPGGSGFQVCVEEICASGVNGPPLKPENITIVMSE
jgi:hypothetical protein